MMWFDKDKTLRIAAITKANGDAVMTWLDKDGKQRMNASTKADGTAILPTTDLKPEP